MSGMKTKLMVTEEDLNLKPSIILADKDKLWIVIYVGVKDIAWGDRNAFMESIHEAMAFDETVQVLLIPCSEKKDAHVEVLYDPHSTVDNFQEEIDKIKKYIKEYEKEYKKKND